MNRIVPANYIPSANNRESYFEENKIVQRFLTELQNFRQPDGSIVYQELPLKNEKYFDEELKENSRYQLESLNKKSFANWDKFYRDKFNKSGMTIQEKQFLVQCENQITEVLVNHSRQGIETPSNFYLIRPKMAELNQNRLQFVHNGGFIFILVNGLPTVQITLQPYDVDIEKVFRQSEYKFQMAKTRFGPLYEYVQLLIISNGVETRYYANTIRQGDNVFDTQRPNFSFTTRWTDQDNQAILDLVDFTKSFLQPEVLLQILTRYLVLTTSNHNYRQLLVMRPYQINAVEATLECVKKRVDGYVWHTTGSGKTLTSFKIAKLLSQEAEIKEVIFVVDRRSLDDQTVGEYRNYESNVVEQVKNVQELAKVLSDSRKKMVVTTFQKLNRLVEKWETNPHQKPFFDQRMIFIFDECHRSTFGDMMKAIRSQFTNINIYGFTGTPIFGENAYQKRLTTKDVFGAEIAHYTITNAIDDGNVLPFFVTTTAGITIQDDVVDKKVAKIDEDSIKNNPHRIKENVRFLLEHFPSLVGNFSSILATESIAMAQNYYQELKSQINQRNQQIQIAIIYSQNDNFFDDSEDDFVDVTSNGQLSDQDRWFLSQAMSEYGKQFGQSFQSKHWENNFKSYQADVTKRVREGEVQILIVVGMYLTGFDAKKVRTLWVDKNLSYHNLIQAFSRTNRIYGPEKPWGNVITFRNLLQNTQNALALFGDQRASTTVLIRNFNDFYYGYKDLNGSEHRGYLGLCEAIRGYGIDDPNVSWQDLRDRLQAEGRLLSFEKLANQIYLLHKQMDSFFLEEERHKIKDALSDEAFSVMQQIYLNEFWNNRYKVIRGENVSNDVKYQVEVIQNDTYPANKLIRLVLDKLKAGKSFKNVFPEARQIIDTHINLLSKKDLIETFLAKFNGMSSEEIEQILRQKNLEQLLFDDERESLKKSVSQLVQEYKLKPDRIWELLIELAQNTPKNIVLEKVLPSKEISNLFVNPFPAWRKYSEFQKNRSMVEKQILDLTYNYWQLLQTLKQKIID